MSKFVFQRVPSPAAAVAILGLLATSAIAQPAGHGADFTGTYEFIGPLLAIGPCDGVINGKWETRCTNYPYNEAGRQKTIAALDDGSVDCVPDGLARLNMRTLYHIQIWHEPEAVKIKYQFGDIVRTIHLDGEPAPADTEHSLHGYSIGKWMGDTLQIETTHLSPSYFAPIGGGRMGGPTSDHATIIERWWPSPTDGNLLMDMVLDDPVNYDSSFLLHRREWQETDLGKLEPWNCVPASEVLFEDDPDLDKFFEN
jgi:hypothetical protein